MWYTWFDRDLTVAGRVIIREKGDGGDSYAHKLVRVQEPILRIPTLAIHLDRLVQEFCFITVQSLDTLAISSMLLFVIIVQSLEIEPPILQDVDSFHFESVVCYSNTK